ncbi:hypothetical protein QCD60_21480 [Pokkaliibacter sp. MBI-7]|uniref:flagellar basal body-associated FliL family protein n=1 Tax=Pokkaliibacter sp. MBI-7 TaxID=3040600 RepID=UPI00244753C0|nr:flagellar basal body-associated FliL family protein [Pokkaliibacter sp. MBI-7]MDH2435102.1 hypothetical protein [Pokkaliibacter sp. MBI-7]
MTVRLHYLGVAVCLLLAGCDKSDNSDFAKVLQFEGAISPSGNRDPIPEHFLQVPETQLAVPGAVRMDISITLEAASVDAKKRLQSHMPLVQHYLNLALAQVNMQSVKDERSRELVLMQVRDFVNQGLQEEDPKMQIQRVLVDHLWVDRKAQ